MLPNPMDNNSYFTDLKPTENTETPQPKPKRKKPAKSKVVPQPKAKAVDRNAGKVSVTYWVDPEVKAKLKAVSYFTDSTMTDIANDALKGEIARLEKIYNEGKPFPVKRAA